MIKSYTESGGTTLSTDWSKIGQGEWLLILAHGRDEADVQNRRRYSRQRGWRRRNIENGEEF